MTIANHLMLLIGVLFAGLAVFFFFLASSAALEKPLTSKIRKRVASIFGWVGVGLILLHFMTKD